MMIEKYITTKKRKLDTLRLRHKVEYSIGYSNGTQLTS